MIAETSNIHVPKRGYECFNACIVNSFSKNNLELSSSDIFFSMGDQPLEENENSMLEVFSSKIFLEKYNVYCKKDLYCEENVKEFLYQNTTKPDGHLILKIRPEMIGYSKLFSTNMGAGHYVNIIYADDKQVQLVDGYTPNPMGSGFYETVDIDELVRAWKVERNKYRFIRVPQIIDLDDIKREARENVARYVNNSHSLLQNCDSGVPEHMILRMFWRVIERMKQGEVFDNEFISFFFYDIRVRGFLIVNNMMWEKISECSKEDAEEYLRLITRWNQLLLFMRKYMMKNMTEKIIRLYGDIVALVKEEDELLMKAFGNIYYL